MSTPISLKTWRDEKFLICVQRKMETSAGTLFAQKKSHLKGCVIICFFIFYHILSYDLKYPLIVVNEEMT